MRPVLTATPASKQHMSHAQKRVPNPPVRNRVHTSCEGTGSLTETFCGCGGGDACNTQTDMHMTHGGCRETAVA